MVGCYWKRVLKVNMVVWLKCIQIIKAPHAYIDIAMRRFRVFFESKGFKEFGNYRFCPPTARQHISKLSLMYLADCSGGNSFCSINQFAQIKKWLWMKCLTRLMSNTISSPVSCPFKMISSNDANIFETITSRVWVVGSKWTLVKNFIATGFSNAHSSPVIHMNLKAW